MSEKDATVLASLLAQVPWKVRVLLIASVMFGPSILFAMFFASLWTGWLPSPITVNTEHLIYIRGKLDSSTKEMHERVADNNQKDEHMIRLLLATCRNVSKTLEERRDCDTYWVRMSGR